jgi:hypothetical protein
MGKPAAVIRLTDEEEKTLKLIFYTMPAEVGHFQKVAILKTA